MKYLFFIAFLFSLQACRFFGEEVDMIVHNARIYTVNANFDMAEAMAIKDGKIVAIGAEREILNKYSSDRIVDCGKRFVYPGFIDAHCHFLAYGHTLQEANFVGTTSWADVLDRLIIQAANKPDGWLIGRGWDQNDWPDHSFPSRETLDSLFSTRPVYLTRIDGHAALVNSKALQLAGINEDTKVVGGTVEVENGKCTGLLVDNAMDFIEKILPARSKADKIDALQQAQAKCFEVGLTTVDEAGLLKPDIDLIDSLQQAGVLQMRIYAMLSDVPSNYDYYLEHGIDTTSEKLTVRAFKFYADGALGSRGACLLSPYEDLLAANRVEYGFLLDTLNHYRYRYAQLYDKGFQVCTHAIGDSANRVILNMYEEFLGGSNDLRWRIEHAQVVDSADINLFGRNSIIPSVQPTHATSDMPWAITRLGRNRVRRAYAYGALKSQLGMLALGTDFPVEDISPFATFRAAVYRVNGAGMPSGGWQTENALTREEALRGMTIWAAMSNFEDHRKGSLEEGKLADFIILQKDLLEVGPLELGEALVQSTYVGGLEVFRRKR